MKTTSLHKSLLLFIVLFSAGCKKEMNEAKLQSSDTNDTSTATSKQDECRLVNSSSEYGQTTYTYNSQGLVDIETISYIENGKAQMFYNDKGQLQKSLVYSGDLLLYKILMHYLGNKVVKETWYDGSTGDKIDEVFYSYNQNGRVYKEQSFMGDYSSIYHYTPDGNSVDKWTFFISGILNYQQVFTYLPPHHKMPTTATPGVDHDFLTVNGWWGNSRWWSTSEKDIVYDENGQNPLVIFDQDPRQTVTTTNSHDYPLTTNYFDKVSQTWAHFIFNYENCGDSVTGNENSFDKNRQSPGSNISNGTGIFLHRGSPELIKQQLNNLRKKYATTNKK